MEAKTALVIGGTGLVGRQLIKLLIKNPTYQKIKYFGRNQVDLDSDKLEFIPTNFQMLHSIKEEISGDVLFSCLGTTIKKAGSKEEQYKVDFDFQLNFAKLAAEKGVENYVLVSSLGAHQNSHVFYTRVKGQLEQAIKKLKFRHCVIIRPSLLSGKRKEKRLGEQFAAKLSWLIAFIPYLKKYRAIPAKTVAKSMIKASDLNCDTVVFEADELFELAKDYTSD
ncbi:NAD(P)H-binding protein [Luteibaculum oceani]|uniref:NAD-dependent epimerase/dehydratase family protein n=1 Tax=Luteibaculum oceani TaxID=1294296 RepID=A0A5C6VA57_9FLAO|nr:NAD(P)H-binding protein [Luteibaculum oceani]TXC82147.1 NAD-dependent epimerase/dehydratase family protein [Luteibaculum oceani]